MDNKIVITKHKNCIINCLCDEKRIIQLSIDANHSENDTQKAGILGNIYLGRVKNIVKNINAAFVEISDGRMCYYEMNPRQKPVFATKSNSEQLKIGDVFLVQVEKDDVKTKAPVVTANFSLTGKYIVLVHGSTKLGISNKLDDPSEKKRLKKILSPYVKDDENYGFIVRTNAINVEKELIEAEAERLIASYKELITFGVHKKDSSLVYKALPAFLCTIRDGFAESVSKIITDDIFIFEQIKAYMEEFQKEDLPKLEMYKGEIQLKALYKIPTCISDLQHEKVWLKSGGSIIIQPTEALTVIDVNTEKAVLLKKSIQDTFFKVNLEAAAEIAYQIRLRNLSGIIIIDFIDMESIENKQILLKQLAQYFESDPIKSTVVDMTALGLVEITRKKNRKPLHEQIKYFEISC